MLIYILQEKSNLSTDIIENNTIVFLQKIEQSELVHTDSLNIELFGIPITQLEINQYNSHYSIWKDFTSRSDEFCLIIEVSDYFIYCKDLFGKSDYELENPEIILPFIPFKDKSLIFDMTYTYGQRLGVPAYYINKKTAYCLLQYQTIELPIDEFFLYLFKRNFLSINFLENELFNVVQDDMYFNDRNENKLKTILSTNYWRNNDKNKGLDILKYIFLIAKELDLSLFLSDGTLLGFVRHGEIMGWDDDIDISIEDKYIQALISKIKFDNVYQISEHFYYGKTRYYKVWDSGNDEVPGYGFTFPFVDIWLFVSDNNIVDFGYKEANSYSSIFPLENVLFHNIEVKVPQDSLTYLDQSYPNWKTSIQIFTLNHKTEIGSNFPLQADIETDLTGRLLLK